MMRHFLPPDVVSDSSHVLTFWQEAAAGEEGILRMFFCHYDEEDHHVQIIRDLHSLPVNHATVSFVRAMHLMRRCLGGRLFSLPYLESITMKIAYIELSNIFRLTNKNVVWMMTHDGNVVDNNELMIGLRFLLDNFVQEYPNMHTYPLVNYFSKLITFDTTTTTIDASDDNNDGDYISHLECQHLRREPQIVDQDFITPDQLSMEGKFACKGCSSSSPLMNTDVILHTCKALDISTTCYTSRSFIMHYDVTSGLEQNMCEQNLSVTPDNVSSFFPFYTRQQHGKFWKGHWRVQGRGHSHVNEFHEQSSGKI